MNIDNKSRTFLSSSNKTNIILIILGLILFVLLGGSAVAFPGLISFIGGTVGLIKNHKKNEKDLKLPWIVLVSIVFLSLGLLSLIMLMSINPVEQIERGRQLQ